MNALLSFLRLSRSSNRLIQAVALAFVLSLGVSMAAPAMQAASASPDTQVICLGQGGMKTITFAADGTATEVQTAHSPNCLLCAALQAFPPTNQASIGLQAINSLQPASSLDSFDSTFERRSPPARAPPLTSKN